MRDIFDEQVKCKPAFALFGLDLPSQYKAILMGHKKNYSKIYEIIFEHDDEQEIYQF
jgi:hypothetical protein